MAEPAMHFAFLVEREYALQFTNDTTVFDVPVKETGYTHFAGPIKAAELPEPSRVELMGEIGDYFSISGHSPFTYELKVKTLLPAWCRYSTSKITLEKVENH